MALDIFDNFDGFTTGNLEDRTNWDLSVGSTGDFQGVTPGAVQVQGNIGDGIYNYTLPFEADSARVECNVDPKTNGASSFRAAGPMVCTTLSQKTGYIFRLLQQNPGVKRFNLESYNNGSVAVSKGGLYEWSAGDRTKIEVVSVAPGKVDVIAYVNGVELSRLTQIDTVGGSTWYPALYANSQALSVNPFIDQFAAKDFTAIEEPAKFLKIPDRFAQPELLIPGRKPVGPVEIDYQHPLAENLEIAYLFPSMQNYVKTGRDPAHLRSQAPPVPGVGLGGSCFQFSTDPDEYLSAGNVFIPGFNDFTLTAVFSSTSQSADQCLIARAEASSNNDRYAIQIEDSLGQGQLKCFFDNGIEYSQIGGPDLLDGLPHVVSMVIYSSAIGSYKHGYVDGVRVMTELISNQTSIDDDHILYFGHFNDGAAGEGSTEPPIDGINPFIGEYYAVFMHRRALAPNQLRDFGRNPYQLLKPMVF